MSREIEQAGRVYGVQYVKLTDRYYVVLGGNMSLVQAEAEAKRLNRTLVEPEIYGDPETVERSSE